MPIEYVQNIVQSDKIITERVNDGVYKLTVRIKVWVEQYNIQNGESTSSTFFIKSCDQLSVDREGSLRNELSDILMRYS